MSDQDKTPENPKTDARGGFGQSTRRSFLSRLGIASLLASTGPAFGERARRTGSHPETKETMPAVEGAFLSPCG